MPGERLPIASLAVAGRRGADRSRDHRDPSVAVVGQVLDELAGGHDISNTTKFPEEAWQALKVITSPASLEKVAKAGRGYPACQSAVPAFKAPDQPPKNVDVVEKILSQSAGTVRFFKTMPTWQETQVMLTREFNPIYLGQQSVQQIVASVKPKFDELLKKHQELAKR